MDNLCIVCDGTKVIGLGNIGTEGAFLSWKGNPVLFKALGGINAFPV
jgi:malate dehydrogenase (oxaloacetate-decarboxylating)